MAVKVDDISFQKEVMESDILAVVDFWAPWCAPCTMIAPLIDEIANEYIGKVKICKLNVDDSPDIASQYRIMSIPTLLFIKNGEIVDQIIGAVSKNVIKEKIDQYL